MKFERSYSVGSSVWISEKSCFSEIAVIESFLVLENAKIVVLLVLEN
jgi:hypothetical protein